MAALVDTNILVYRHDPRFPDKQRIATQLLRDAAAYQFPWFDAHLWAYAEHYGLPELISEDFHAGRVYGTVRIRNPFEGTIRSEPAGE